GARINYKLPAEIITASLEIIASNTSVWLSFPIDNNSTYYLLSPLDPLTGYYYRIKIVCSDGTFNFTPNAKFSTTGYKNGEIVDAASSAENGNELTVSCFPNPATNSISVNIMGESDQLVDVKLSTIYGHIVFESKFSENVVHEINVKNYPKGIYVLRVSKTGKTSSVKFVIN
ncbi:MAG TPA: T9SS type A sorting domain-containing protein, partial [Anaerovoracaceae bacterium]|nr:T9SS type A sorting domain-containing protein [Anaerovoracaceae bacterium]